MSAAPGNPSLPTQANAPSRGQWLKWTIYTLLLLNGGFYLVEEAQMAAHTLGSDAGLVEWAGAFTTTIDNFAWYGLLLAFELETYALEDEAFERRWVSRALHGLRLLCYVMLLHTVVARVAALDQAYNAPERNDINSVCQLADQEISWGHNFDYATISRENCSDFGTAAPFYMIEETVVTDRDGWIMEKRQTTVDLLDALVWLLVIFSIELAVWLQNRNISGGPVMLASFAAKGLYAVLFAHAAWWIYTGHFVYAWDQTLWILGFWAIEKNLSEWRDDIRGPEPPATGDGDNIRQPAQA